MKIRYGLVLAMAIGLGLTGCASGGGGGGGAGGLASLGGAAGENPRNTDNTRQAERALDAAEGATGAEARTLYEQARDAAQAAITEDGRNPLAHRLAAMAALGLEDWEAAGAHFDHAVELRPLYEFDFIAIREGTWIDLYQRATPFVQAGDYESAVSYFEGANAVYSGRPEAIITLGQIYAQLREHDQALEAMDEAMAFASSPAMIEMEAADSTIATSWKEQIAEVPLLRAQVLTDAGRFEEAGAVYRELSANDPGNVEYKRGLARILTETGDEAGATAIYEEMLSMPATSAEDMFVIGVGFYQMSDYTRSVDAFSGAARMSENDRDAIEMWARSLQLDSAYADVPPVAERWLELDPNSQNAWLVLAQAANANGDQATTQRAIQAVDELEVAISDLQLRRFLDGGGQVTGGVVNKKLDQGATVSLRFTFYSADGTPLGTVTESVSVGNVDMSEVFSVQFDSAETVDGYGYVLTVN